MKGGTAIHFMFTLVLFSEDLDFSTSYSKPEIINIVKIIEARLQKELPENKMRILDNGRNGIRFRWRWVMPDFKYPLVIRLDFSVKQNCISQKQISIMTKLPLFFSNSDLFISGRDFGGKNQSFIDPVERPGMCLILWFLIRQKIKINKILLQKKLDESS